MLLAGHEPVYQRAFGPLRHGPRASRRVGELRRRRPSWAAERTTNGGLVETVLAQERRRCVRRGRAWPAAGGRRRADGRGRRSAARGRRATPGPGRRRARRGRGRSARGGWMRCCSASSRRRAGSRLLSSTASGSAASASRRWAGVASSWPRRSASCGAASRARLAASVNGSPPSPGPSPTPMRTRTSWARSGTSRAHACPARRAAGGPCRSRRCAAPAPPRGPARSPAAPSCGVASVEAPGPSPQSQQEALHGAPARAARRPRLDGVARRRGRRRACPCGVCAACSRAHGSGVERSRSPASSSVGTGGRSPLRGGAGAGVGGQRRQVCAKPLPTTVARS